MNITVIPKEMSTREIAALINKEHRNIRISAERLEKSGTVAVRWSKYNHNGNDYTEGFLNKTDSIVLAAQNCPEVTANIVRRWEQLESQAALPASTGNPMLDAVIETQRQVTEQKQVQIMQSKEIAAIKHKLEFSGCSNGFVPWAQLYNMYGGSFPKQRFKSILILMGVDKERYHFTADGGFPASGDSFRESQVKSAFSRFISGLIQVSPEFCQHQDHDIGRIRYKIKKPLALEVV